MAGDRGVSFLRKPEIIDGGNLEPAAVDMDEVHVLAVDDSVVDRIVIEKLLRITSCKVTAVDSGWRALQFLGLDDEKNSSGFDNLKVDLIITDYCMPGMTGYELLKKIKESSSFREIPVVIMSSENVLARIDRCLEEGAEDFLLKPVKLADVKRLRNYLTREIKVPNVNKRKLPEDSGHLSTHPLAPLSSESPESSPPSLADILTLTPPSPAGSMSTSSPPSPAESMSSSSPPSPASELLTSPPSKLLTSPPSELITSPPSELITSPPSEFLTSPPSELLTSPPSPSMSPEDSPSRRQRMTSPGLD